MYSNAFVVYMTKQHKKHYDKQRDTMKNNERHTETDMQQDNKIGRRKATSERREKKRREKGPKTWQERKCISFRTLCCATKLVDVHVHGTKYLCIYIYILHKTQIPRQAWMQQCLSQMEFIHGVFMWFNASSMCFGKKKKVRSNESSVSCPTPLFHKKQP